MNEGEEPKKKSKTRMIDLIFIIVIIAGFLTYISWPSLSGIFSEEEEPLPADVELLRFDDRICWEINETGDRTGNATVNIEIWITNIGNEVAKDISVFARCRNQDGTVLREGNISVTYTLLRQDESCSGFYSVSCSTDDKWVESTLEISWKEGHNLYLKKSTLI